MSVQAILSDATVERFDLGVTRGLPLSRKTQFNAMPIDPLVDGL